MNIRRPPYLWAYITAAALISAALYCAVPRAAPASAGVSVQLPVIMYHSVLKDPARHGKYVVSPQELEDDLAYLKRQGYTAVLPRELAAYAAGRGALPDRPVMLTFDDGHYNNLTYALPLLEEYGMKAVISAVGAYTEAFSESPDPNPNYGYCSWQELLQLNQSGRFELGNHSYDLHRDGARRGCARMRGEGRAEYRALLTEDTARMQRALLENCGAAPITYAYPYGAISPESCEPLKELGFLCTLSCYEHPNLITAGDPDCLYQLGRYNRPGGESTADFMQRCLAEG